MSLKRFCQSLRTRKTDKFGKLLQRHVGLGQEPFHPLHPAARDLAQHGPPKYLLESTFQRPPRNRQQSSNISHIQRSIISTPDDSQRFSNDPIMNRLLKRRRRRFGRVRPFRSTNQRQDFHRNRRNNQRILDRIVSDHTMESFKRLLHSVQILRHHDRPLRRKKPPLHGLLHKLPTQSDPVGTPAGIMAWTVTMPDSRKQDNDLTRMELSQFRTIRLKDPATTSKEDNLILGKNPSTFPRKLIEMRMTFRRMHPVGRNLNMPTPGHKQPPFPRTRAYRQVTKCIANHPPMLPRGVPR